jgi:uncharacterized protein YndB with AHSA1/START domain
VLTIRSASATRTMHLPPSAVWAVLTDLEGLARVRRHVQASQVLTPAPFEVGTRWRETRRGRGRATTIDMTVETVLPDEGYEAAGTIDGTTCRLTFHLVRRGPGITMVVSTFDVESPVPGSVVRRTAEMVFGTRAGRAFRTQMADDLADVERAARALTVR